MARTAHRLMGRRGRHKGPHWAAGGGEGGGARGAGVLWGAPRVSMSSYDPQIMTQIQPKAPMSQSPTGGGVTCRPKDAWVT